MIDWIPGRDRDRERDMVLFVLRTPVTSGMVPDVTMVQGTELAIRSLRRDLAPGISTASSP